MDHDGDLADPAVPAPPVDLLDDLIDQGRARPALVPRARFAEIPRGTSTVPSAEILRDVRGRW